jgi:hypothetical protein
MGNCWGARIKDGSPQPGASGSSSSLLFAAVDSWGWYEGNLDDPVLLVARSDQAGGYGMRDLIRLTCMIVVQFLVDLIR